MDEQGDYNSSPCTSYWRAKNGHKRSVIRTRMRTTRVTTIALLVLRIGELKMVTTSQVNSATMQAFVVSL